MAMQTQLRRRLPICGKALLFRSGLQSGNGLVEYLLPLLIVGACACLAIKGQFQTYCSDAMTSLTNGSLEHGELSVKPLGKLSVLNDPHLQPGSAKGLHDVSNRAEIQGQRLATVNLNSNASSETLGGLGSNQLLAESLLIDQVAARLEKSPESFPLLALVMNLANAAHASGYFLHGMESSMTCTNTGCVDQT